MAVSLAIYGFQVLKSASLLRHHTIMIASLFFILRHGLNIGLPLAMEWEGEDRETVRKYLVSAKYEQEAQIRFLDESLDFPLPSPSLVLLYFALH